MKNKIIYKLKSKIKLNIKGKNINRFLIRLNNNNIDILENDQIEKDEANIIIYLRDYGKLKNIKTIYNINELDEYGKIKIKKQLNKNKYIILSLILGYISLILLSNIIFEIEIIHTDKELKNLLKNELKMHGIKEKTFKKTFKELEQIKEDILNKNKDKIEWLEIETKGTKYIVRVEMRIINENKKEEVKRNIIAKKDAIIKEIKAKHGQITKEINNYVKKGDVIISGNIYVEETLKNTVQAEGKVFGEVWYETKITYPFVYNETRLTNEKKTIYAIKILNKIYEIRKKFTNKEIEETTIIKNNIIPISLVKQKQTKKEVIEQILTTDEAIEKATKKSLEQMNKNLKEGEYIINYKILNTNIKENELELNIFFSIYEDITDYEIITEENLSE